MARSSLPRGMTKAVRDSAFAVLETELVGGNSFLGAESTQGIARGLTSMFLTVE